MTTVRDVIEAMETIAPPALALQGDPVGLHSGRLGQKVRKILLCVDASLRAVAEAEAMGADMLVAHHPRFYRGLSTLAAHDASGRRAAAILKSGIAVYSAHTNLDMADGGTNDTLADLLGLEDRKIVKVEKRESLLKLAVFVPVSHMQNVLRAVCDAGAGAIGSYSDCTFRAKGVGTFRCGDDTNPFIGKPGSYEEADEYRLETVFREFSAGKIVAAMKKAHPYEEVAYDLYPLVGGGKTYGFGRLGELPKRESAASLAARMAKATGSRMTQYHGKAGRRIRHVVAWAGGGVDTAAVLASGAEALVAGEVGYHDLETLSDGGMSVIVLGHGYSEAPVLKALAKRLAALVRGVQVATARRSDFSFVNI